MTYWEDRYRRGGNSGPGSAGVLAQYKADFLNDLVAARRIRNVIEFGCGDGTQLALAAYPNYLGLDPSPTAVRLCTERFAGDPTKRFLELRGWNPDHGLRLWDLALSLDVVYHLLDDNDYLDHMERLFAPAPLVVIYAPNLEGPTRLKDAVRFRRFTDWTQAHLPDWAVRHYDNPYPFAGNYHTGTASDFWIFEAPQ